MPKSCLWLSALALCACLALPGPAQAQEDAAADQDPEQAAAFGPRRDFDPGAGVSAKEDGLVHMGGRPYTLRTGGKVHAGVFVPDGQGGYVWLGSDDQPPMPDPVLEQARELRLRIRELAEQLLPPGSEAVLRGQVALPSSFVNQDNLDQSSSFGRLVAEQMFHELARRGVAVREYRALPSVETRPGDGDFALSRDQARRGGPPAGGLVVAGTYYHDHDSVFVNARLFRALDRMVLGTAQLVMPQSDMTRTMLARGTGIRLQSAEIGIKSFVEMKERPDMGYALLEEDLH